MELQPELKREELRRDYGRFALEPLPRGYGVTLGNALRRVLLSSLKGSAITSVRIEGVQHEFSTIPGVLESVTDIVLNLKQVRFRVGTEEPQTLTLRQSGAKEVTASMIELPSQVEVVNPEQRIATLTSKDAKLTMEMTVRRGTGYVPAERHTPQHEIGVIPLDAIFSPVRKVNIVVEDTRVGQVTDYNRLILEIWTDGSLEPEAALIEAASILVKYYSLLIPKEEPPKDLARKEEEEKLAMPIESLEFGTRTYGCLKRMEIHTVGQLIEKTEEELLSIENFGRKCLEEVQAKLEAMSLGLRVTA